MKSKTLKRLAILGVIGFVVVTSLTIWAGISAIGYVANLTTQAAQHEIPTQYFQRVQDQVNFLTSNRSADCWSKAQSLLAIQPWLETPVDAHIKSLSSVCIETKIKGETI